MPSGYLGLEGHRVTAGKALWQIIDLDINLSIDALVLSLILLLLRLPLL